MGTCMFDYCNQIVKPPTQNPQLAFVVKSGTVQTVVQCLWHRFRENMCSHSKFHQSTERSGFMFCSLSARRNATLAKLLGSTMSTGVIPLSTGLLPGITPALFNSVIQTTTECCFIRVLSQTLCSLTASEMSPWNFWESVPGLCPASAGEIHERAQLPFSNLHSDTHRQACMAPIDRLMVARGTKGCLAVLKSGQL